MNVGREANEKPRPPGDTAAVSTVGTGGSDVRSSADEDDSVAQRLSAWENGVSIEKLTEREMKIHQTHLYAVQLRQEKYIDPFTGYSVFTIVGHLARGSCCGNACRHCPYKHVNAKPELSSKLRHNSAFYTY